MKIEDIAQSLGADTDTVNRFLSEKKMKAVHVTASTLPDVAQSFSEWRGGAVATVQTQIQPTAQPQVQTPTPQTNSKLTVEAFTGAVTNDVASAKAEIARVRQAAEGELMSYAKEQIAIYQGFKGALPAAMAGFLSSAAWEPAVLTFDVSAEPVHQLTAGA